MNGQFPGGSGLCSLLQGTWVWSLVGELGSHKLCSIAKKKKKAAKWWKKKQSRESLKLEDKKISKQNWMGDEHSN